jgi:hypothetical protein
MIGVFRTDLTYVQQIVPVNWKRILEPVEVPILEQRHVETHMGWSEVLVVPGIGEEIVQMSDIVHFDLFYT